jgi:hypothetical protein
MAILAQPTPVITIGSTGRMPLLHRDNRGDWWAQKWQAHFVVQDRRAKNGRDPSTRHLQSFDDIDLPSSAFV